MISLLRNEHHSNQLVTWIQRDILRRKCELTCPLCVLPEHTHILHPISMLWWQNRIVTPRCLSETGFVLLLLLFLTHFPIDLVAMPRVRSAPFLSCFQAVFCPVWSSVLSCFQVVFCPVSKQCSVIFSGSVLVSSSLLSCFQVMFWAVFKWWSVPF